VSGTDLPEPSARELTAGTVVAAGKTGQAIQGAEPEKPGPLRRVRGARIPSRLPDVLEDGTDGIDPGGKLVAFQRAFPGSDDLMLLALRTSEAEVLVPRSIKKRFRGEEK